MAAYGMIMNAEKTTYGVIKPRQCTVEKVLGSDLEGAKEAERRRRAANAAFTSMKAIFSRSLDHVTVATKVRVYNAFVYPYFLQNAGATAYSKAEVDKLEATQRGHLRRLLGIFYPRRIKNIELHTATSTKPVSQDITRARWAFLGHILRLPRDAPAQLLLLQYYRRRPQQFEEVREATRRSRNLGVLPRQLQREANFLSDRDRQALLGTVTLNRETDFVLYRAIAAQRGNWGKVVAKVEEAARRLWEARQRRRTAARAEQSARVVVNAGRGRGRDGGEARGRGRGRGRGRPPLQRPLPPNQPTIMEAFARTQG
jgi:hypothetical protein